MRSHLEPSAGMWNYLEPAGTIWSPAPLHSTQGGDVSESFWFHQSSVFHACDLSYTKEEGITGIRGWAGTGVVMNRPQEFGEATFVDETCSRMRVIVESYNFLIRFTLMVRIMVGVVVFPQLHPVEVISLFFWKFSFGLGKPMISQKGFFVVVLRF